MGSERDILHKALNESRTLEEYHCSLDLLPTICFDTNDLIQNGSAMEFVNLFVVFDVPRNVFRITRILECSHIEVQRKRIIKSLNR